MQDKNESQTIEVVCYTDPLCCWSWAMEPLWQRLRSEAGQPLSWRYVMSGLISNWQTYNDPVNAISRPLQMGPLWYEAKHRTGVPINDLIWLNDPPASSYPACIAVKCAGLQSAHAEEAYLQDLRQAVMLKEKNIARPEVLQEVAQQTAQHTNNLLDANRLTRDLESGAGVEAFRQDLQNVRYHQIGRFPSLVFRKAGGQAVLLVGYRPYDVLLQALAAVTANENQQQFAQAKTPVSK